MKTFEQIVTDVLEALTKCLNSIPPQIAQDAESHDEREFDGAKSRFKEKVGGAESESFSGFIETAFGWDEEEKTTELRRIAKQMVEKVTHGSTPISAVVEVFELTDEDKVNEKLPNASKLFLALQPAQLLR